MSRRLALFTFIDAFGWEILQTHRFLGDERVVSHPLTTIFGYSATCDPTILTGALPRDHGHFSFFTYGPDRSPFRTARLFCCLPQAIARRGRVRHFISKWYGRYLGFTGYFQLYNMPFRRLHLFDYTERRDIYQPGGINGGQPTVFDHLRRRRIPFFLADWRRGEEANLKALEAAIQSGRIRFAYLYLAAMDAVLHADGTRSRRVDDKIAWYDARLRGMLAAARRVYDEVNLYVFSDHGMTDVRETCDLMARIEALPLRFGRDYAAVYDSTMARFWFLKPGARETILAALHDEPLGDVLSDETLSAWGCDFPNRVYGDLFFLMKPGVLLNPSFMGEFRLAGMHGYDPNDRDSTAMFLATCRPPVIPRRLDDLFHLMIAEAED